MQDCTCAKFQQGLHNAVQAVAQMKQVAAAHDAAEAALTAGVPAKGGMEYWDGDPIHRENTEAGPILPPISQQGRVMYAVGMREALEQALLQQAESGLMPPGHYHVRVTRARYDGDHISIDFSAAEGAPNEGAQKALRSAAAWIEGRAMMEWAAYMDKLSTDDKRRAMSFEAYIAHRLRAWAVTWS